MIGAIKAWYKKAPSPVSWFVVFTVLYAWLVFISFMASLLFGGMDEVRSNLPTYAQTAGFKLLKLYVVLVIFFCFSFSSMQPSTGGG